MDQGKPLLEISKEMQVSPDRIRYWVKLLETELEKQGHVCYLNPKVVKQIIAMNNLIKNGLSPKEASRRIKEVETVKPMEIQPVIAPTTQVDLSPILAKLEALEKGMFFVAERIAGLEKENKFLRFQLMPPEKPSVSVKPWEPEKVRDPLEGMSWYHRVWVKCFEPWKMRRFTF
ncbi:MAG: MerR family transcriptional regulator [Candidatus Riflebacteria bacterium]|nr:MerR family transcriptional regulator [Candidatus Riflebacteria bacterium]